MSDAFLIIQAPFNVFKQTQINKSGSALKNLDPLKNVFSLHLKIFKFYTSFKAYQRDIFVKEV